MAIPEDKTFRQATLTPHNDDEIQKVERQKNETHQM
jgi:hypothetical protein